MRPLNHLRLNLDIWRVSLTRLFDKVWYLRRYPDILAANVDPLSHFMTFGYKEGRDPNPIFDTKWYKTTYFLRQTDNPILSYIRARSSGFLTKPNPWFDPVWYAQVNNLPRGLDPMLHYLTTGAAEGNLPCADFPHPQLYDDCAASGDPLSYFWHRYAVTGGVGSCTSYFITGWAHRYIGPAIDLTITVNGIPKGAVTPWIERPDVKEVLGRDHALGFFFVFPTRLRSGDKVEIRDEFDRPLGPEPITYNVAPLGAARDLYGTRASVAASFLKGKGIEIGPYTQPTDLSPDCLVTFYDRLSAKKLRDSYDHRCGRPLFEPTIVGEAAHLEGISKNTCDFIIANHVIEHLETPIAFLQAVSSALTDGGCAMIVAPDKRYSFDVNRQITSFAHLLDEHKTGHAKNKRSHIIDVLIKVVGIDIGATDERELERLISELGAEDRYQGIHYHVWDDASFIDFIQRSISTFSLPVTLIYHEAANNEIIVVMQKTVT